MDRGAWQATVHGVTKSQTRLSDYHTEKTRAMPPYLFVLSLASPIPSYIVSAQLILVE